MTKIIHIAGIVAGYLACVIMIVVGAINQTPDVAGWKFIMLGIALSICATIALLDGARAFPTIGMWKVGAKFKGLSDLAFIIIFAIVLITGLIAMFA
ncbi:MAG: hypothetical protein ACJAUP_002119 [Cellvibrionaceae bacterium]|jgi:hypothetical protein